MEVTKGRGRDREREGKMVSLEWVSNIECFPEVVKNMEGEGGRKGGMSVRDG